MDHWEAIVHRVQLHQVPLLERFCTHCRRHQRDRIDDRRCASCRESEAHITRARTRLEALEHNMTLALARADRALARSHDPVQIGHTGGTVREAWPRTGVVRITTGGDWIRPIK